MQGEEEEDDLVEENDSDNDCYYFLCLAFGLSPVSGHEGHKEATTFKLVANCSAEIQNRHCS